MAITFKTPSQIADEYLTNLKVLKPEVNIDQTDSDWYVRALVLGGVGSGLYEDQSKIASDAFPQSARDEAIQRFLFEYFNGTYLQAQPSHGNVGVTGTNGSIVATGIQFLHPSTGNLYQATSTITLVGPTASVPVQSVGNGQSQNLFDNTALTLSSPPAGINAAAATLGQIADGRDQETIDEASARILSRIRTPVSGGTANDYITWAMQASASVTSARVQRFIFGLGSVGVYITSGTTNIDEAIDNNQAIVRIPSDLLISQVSAYIDSVNPLTDCAHVLKPSEVPQDVTAVIAYAEGLNGSTILAGQTLTLDQIVTREITRAVYKIPIGGRTIGSNGYVLASEIEEALDFKLSDEPYAFGQIAQVLIDRQISPLTASGTNRLLRSNEIVKPGTITLVHET